MNIKDQLQNLSTEELLQINNEINCDDGNLEYIGYNDEEFFNTYFNDRINEAVRAAQYGDYNYIDEYVIINAYGNLDSFNDIQLENYLHDLIDEMADLIKNDSDNDYDIYNFITK